MGSRILVFGYEVNDWMGAVFGFGKDGFGIDVGQCHV